MIPNRIIPLVISVICALCPSVSKGEDALPLMIYRNDGLFHQLPADSCKVTCTHTAGDSPKAIWAYGDTTLSVPLECVDSCVFRPNQVPVFNIDFPEYPDICQLWEKDLYLDASLSIRGNGLTEDSDAKELQIKGRGNSTWQAPKKPMRLKFGSKTSLCGFKKAKNYVLLADYLDATHLKNAVGHWLARRLGIQYSHHTMPVDVTVNGHPQGLYLLSEKVGINGASVDIDETKGVLLELSSEFDEPYKFRSPVFDLPVMIKDPDFDELYADNPDGPTPEERLKLWQEDFNAAEKAANETRGFKYFDLNSAVNYVLLMRLTNNNDNGSPKSFYMWKESLGTDFKYVLGPAWDFDSSFNTPRLSDGEIVHDAPDNPLWHNRLLAKLVNHLEFRTAYSRRVKEFCNDIAPELYAFIDEYAALIEPSALTDGNIWPEEEDWRWMYRLSAKDFRSEVQDFKEWIRSRVEYIRTSP